jgi:chromosome segregation ATPase
MDPRRRNNSATQGFGEGTSNHNTTLQTLDTINKAAAVISPPTPLDGASESVSKLRAQNGVGGISDTAIKGSEMSPIDRIASLLITSQNEACSAAHALRRVDGAKEKLAKAERTDRQNRRIASLHGDFAAYTEQGEEIAKKAAQQLAEEETTKKEADKKRNAAAIALVVELMKATNDAQTSREQEVDICKITDELFQVKQDLSQAKAALATATQEVSELKKDAQQTKTGVQITSKKIDALTDSQKRDIKGLSSEVAKVRLQHNDLGIDIESVRNEFKPMIQELKYFNSDLSELRRENERFNDMKSELGNIRKDNKATAQELRSLQTTVQSLEKTQQEDKITLQDLETLQLEVSNMEKRRKGNATAPDLESLRVGVGELSSKLDDMVQRPEFLRLSSSLSSMADTRAKASSQAVDETRKLLETNLATLKTESSNLQKLVNEIRNTQESREHFITQHLSSHEQRIKQIQADLQKPVTATPPPGRQDTAELTQAMSSIRKDLAAVKKESHDSVTAVTNVLPGVRAAIDGNKANSHSVRSLEQRYVNITSEHMVHAMLRQLEHLYPHAAQHQANFDRVLASIDTLGAQTTDSQKKLEDRVEGAFARVTQDVKGLTTRATKNDTEYRDHLKRIVEDVKSQRDTLKDEITFQIETLKEDHMTLKEDHMTLKEEHMTLYNGLQTKIDGLKTVPAPPVETNTNTSYDSSDLDQPPPWVTAARNPFATGTGTNGGGLLERKRKRPPTVVRRERESPDVSLLEEREGSAPLRAKVAKKG